MNNTSPKIALVGYGSMGKAVKTIAQEKNIIITNIFDENTPLTHSANYEFDVAVDFSIASAVLTNVEILSAMNKKIVIGTTGWADYLPKIEKICERYNNGIIYASNFSIGMQIFSKIIANAAKHISKYSDYDIFLHEMHHSNKSDSPSGTAYSLADIILNNSDSKNKIITDSLNRKITPEELHVSSSRGGSIFGTHTVYIDSLSETIELIHRAKNRNGFAIGAVYAAQWIYEKTGIYNFMDIL